MNAQEQRVAQAQGNVTSFGSVYGMANAPSYLDGTQTSGIFAGATSPVANTPAVSAIADAVPGSESFRQAEIARMQQAAGNERAAIAHIGVGNRSAAPNNGLEVPPGFFAQRYGMATTMMADPSLSLGQRAGALGFATAIAPMMLLEEGGRGMMNIPSDLVSGMQYLDRSSKAGTVGESLRNADMAAVRFLTAGLNVVGAEPAAKAAAIELRGCMTRWRRG